MEKQTKLSKHDIDQLKMLQVIVDSGTYELKGNAIMRTGLVVNFIPSLIAKIEGHLATAGAPKIKKVKETSDKK
jgi:hypothetical protein